MSNRLFICVFFLVSCVEAPDTERIQKQPTPPAPRSEQNTPAVTGTLNEILQTYLPSQSFRNRGTTARSYSTEIEAIITETPNLNYRSVPSIEDTDENVQPYTQNLNNCGVKEEFIKLSQRIDDCALKNSGTNKWSGKINGISGEGDWILVLNIDGFTIMQDQRTGLLWSSNIENNEWVNASGNASDDEPEKNVCTTVKIKYLPKDQISWRLPTRGEFLQADLNGARFVLQDRDELYWTASATDSLNAWAIHQETGIMKIAGKTDSLAVRCIGYPLK